MNKKSNAKQIPTFQPDALPHFRVTNTTHVYGNNHELSFNTAYIHPTASDYLDSPDDGLVACLSVAAQQVGNSKPASLLKC